LATVETNSLLEHKVWE